MAQEQTGKRKKESNFLIQGGILAAAGLLVRVIGLAYRIPLIRIIGDEGMGYYSVAYEIYSIVLLLSSYSLPLAVSKMISTKLAKEEYANAGRILKAALAYATLIGGVGCMFVWLTAGWFAEVFYKLPLCRYALESLAPTIWIMSYLGVMRGYYQGRRTMVPTAVSQIIEQLVNAAVSVGAAWLLCQRALNDGLGNAVARAYGAAGGTIGTGAGAMSALIMFAVLYMLHRGAYRAETQADTRSGSDSYSQIAGALVMTVIPVIVSSAIYNISGIIDAYIYSNIMTGRFAQDASEVAAQYGAFTGKYKTLMNIPVAIANALASSLIPAMSSARARGSKADTNSAVNMSVRCVMLICLPASVGLTVLGGPIVRLLFGASDIAERMTTIGSLWVACYSLSTVTNAILQGCSRMELPVHHAVISLVIHIVSLAALLLVFNMGIYSMPISGIIFALSMCILNAVSIRREVGYEPDIRASYLLPALCSIAMGAVTLLIRLLLQRLGAGNTTICAVCVICAVAVYAVLVTATGCFKLSDLRRRRSS